MLKWIDTLQVDNEAFLSVVYLDELHAVAFGETLAVHSKNWRLSLPYGIHYSFWQLLHFVRLGDHVEVTLSFIDAV